MEIPNMTEPSPSSPAQAAAIQFLKPLLTKNMRVLATDGRLFIGQLKCTDPDCNIILAHTYEYRHPSGATPTLGSDSPSPLVVAGLPPPPSSSNGSSLAGMKSRYLGLIVVPGKHIVKIELEQFASQMRRPQQTQPQPRTQPQTQGQMHPLLPQQQPPFDFGGVI
jgi:small nuclear ribonucleoprotein (snRNP)-like protein